MFCSNCGNKLDDNSNFCTKCSHAINVNISSVNQTNVEQSKVSQKTADNQNNTGNLKKTNLSVAAVVLLLMQFAIPFLTILSNSSQIFNFLSRVPYFLFSLILAIISRIKYKDDLSRIVIIIDVVLIVMAIVGMIIATILLVAFLGTLIKFCTGEEFMSTCEEIGRMG